MDLVLAFWLMFDQKGSKKNEVKRFSTITKQTSKWLKACHFYFLAWALTFIFDLLHYTTRTDEHGWYTLRCMFVSMARTSRAFDSSSKTDRYTFLLFPHLLTIVLFPPFFPLPKISLAITFCVQRVNTRYARTDNKLFFPCDILNKSAILDNVTIAKKRDKFIHITAVFFTAIHLNVCITDVF